jgi:hypothetical protein
MTYRESRPDLSTLAQLQETQTPDPGDQVVAVALPSRNQLGKDSAALDLRLGVPPTDSLDLSGFDPPLSESHHRASRRLVHRRRRATPGTRDVFGWEVQGRWMPEDTVGPRGLPADQLGQTAHRAQALESPLF